MIRARFIAGYAVLAFNPVPRKANEYGGYVGYVGYVGCIARDARIHYVHSIQNNKNAFLSHVRTPPTYPTYPTTSHINKGLEHCRVALQPCTPLQRGAFHG